ncbi:NUDIX hydrolase [Billgrantia lactosivorans]|uniref:NUDIX hydrolase n=1 Tax=Billgrantia lactosivorans TaxID=2185141 RepID=UPI000DADD863|nr:NUDIX domain-containing protein [Halomonas lactosivorans]
MASHERAIPTPIPAVAAAVVHRHSVLMVRRRHAPNAGLLALPGGRVEPGETLFEAAERELREETGIVAEAQRVHTAIDQLEYDDKGGLLSHFIIVVVICRWARGDAVAADDAGEVHWLDASRVRSEPGLCTSARQVASELLPLENLR